MREASPNPLERFLRFPLRVWRTPYTAIGVWKQIRTGSTPSSESVWYSLRQRVRSPAVILKDARASEENGRFVVPLYPLRSPAEQRVSVHVCEPRADRFPSPSPSPHPVWERSSSRVAIQGTPLLAELGNARSPPGNNSSEGFNFRFNGEKRVALTWPKI